MTKKYLAFFMMLAALISSLPAKPVSIEDAIKVAIFDKELSYKKNVSFKDYDSVKFNGKLVLWLIRFNEGGFSAISADDRCRPFCVGSQEGNKSLKNFYKHYSGFIKRRYEIIYENKDEEYIRKYNILQKIWGAILNRDEQGYYKALKEFSQEPNSKKKNQSFEPEDYDFLNENIYEKSTNSFSLATPVNTRWHQFADYNYCCPVYTDMTPPVRTVTGCVALAIAQICKHYAFPAQITGLSPYTVGNGYLAGQIPSNTDFDYLRIPNTNYNTSNSSQGTDLARLIVCIGIAMQNEYADYVEGSAPPPYNINYPDIFNQYLNFRDVQQTSDYISKDSFFKIIKKEIISNRPILLQYYPSGGHMGIVYSINMNTEKINVITGYDWPGLPTNEIDFDDAFTMTNLNKSKLVYNLKNPLHPSTKLHTTDYNAYMQSFVFPKPNWFQAQATIYGYNLWRKNLKDQLFTPGHKAELTKLNASVIRHFDHIPFYQFNSTLTMEEKNTYAYYVSIVYDSTDAGGYTPNGGANEVFSDPIYRMANDYENGTTETIGGMTFALKAGDLLDDTWESSYWPGGPSVQSADGNPDDDYITTTGKGTVPYINYYEQFYNGNPTVIDGPTIVVDEAVRPLKMLQPLVVDRMIWKAYNDDQYMWAARLSSGQMEYELNPEFMVDGASISTYQLQKVEAALGFTYQPDVFVKVKKEILHDFPPYHEIVEDEYFTQRFFMDENDWYTYRSNIVGCMQFDEMETAFMKVARRKSECNDVSAFINLDEFPTSYGNSVVKGHSTTGYLKFNGWYTKQDWVTAENGPITKFYEPVFTTNYVDNKNLKFSTTDYPAPAYQELFDNNVYLALPYVRLNQFSNSDGWINDKAHEWDVGSSISYNPIFTLKIRCTLKNTTNSTTKTVEDFYPVNLNKLTVGTQAWTNDYSTTRLPPWNYSEVQKPGFGNPDLVINPNTNSLNTHLAKVLDLSIKNIDTSINPPFSLSFRVQKNKATVMNVEYNNENPLADLKITDDDNVICTSGFTDKNLKVNITDNYTPYPRFFDYKIKYLKQEKHFTVTQPSAPPNFLKDFTPNITAVMSDYDKNNIIITKHRNIITSFDTRKEDSNYMLNTVVNDNYEYRAYAVCNFDADGDGVDDRAVLYIKPEFQSNINPQSPPIPGKTKIVVYNSINVEIASIDLNYADGFCDLVGADINNDGRKELLAATKYGKLRTWNTYNYTVLQNFDFNSHFNGHNVVSMVALDDHKICLVTMYETVIVNITGNTSNIIQEIMAPGEFVGTICDCAAGDIDNDGNKELIFLYKGDSDYHNYADFVQTYKFDNQQNIYVCEYNRSVLDQLADNVSRIVCGDFIVDNPGDEIAVIVNKSVSDNIYNPSIYFCKIVSSNQCVILKEINTETYLEGDRETITDIDCGSFSIPQNLTITGNINNDNIYRAKGAIKTTGSTVVNAANVTFQAGQDLELNPGFETTETTKNFETKIEAVKAIKNIKGDSSNEK